MRLKIFLAICAASSLSSCSAPEFPKGPICSLVWNESLDKSYGYCAPWDQPSQAVKVPAEELFKGKYIGSDPEYFGKIMQWKRDMESFVKTHCNN